MKTFLKPSGFIALCLVSSCLASAETPAYAAILKERDAVLSKIVAAQEARSAAGHTNQDAVFTSRIALHTFRRDIANSPQAKIAHQQLIVAEQQRKLAAVHGQAQVGGVSEVDVLTATDALLAAKQMLEQL